MTSKATERSNDNPVREHEPQVPPGQPHAGHRHSQAAHLDSGAAEPHTKPAGNLRHGPYHGPYSGGRKQP